MHVLSSRFQGPLLSAVFALAAVIVPSGCGADAVPPAGSRPTAPAEAIVIPAPPRPGAVLWRLDLADPAKRPGPLPTGAQWAADGPDGQPCLRITVGADAAAAQNVVAIPIDVQAWRGMELALEWQGRAEGVSVPGHPWNGVKCMLHWKSEQTGEHWDGIEGLHGTFPWRALSKTILLTTDATEARLLIGMQDCSGSAAIADVRLVAKAVPPVRPAAQAHAAPAYRGHDLPRLRGVMSPNVFREEDFAALEKLNVNFVRWQIGRSWGAVGSDRDLAEYDRWLGTRLDELDVARASARRHGIRLMVDLHSPPGGRLEDSTLAMLVEQPYQDHFVEVWKRIATRLAGDPTIWSYDLVNEPVQNQPSPPGLADWLGIQVKAAKAIRLIDPTTAISIETDGWDSPTRFTWLEPIDVPNIIYQAHMYFPGEYTHQGVRNAWGEQGGSAKMDYPGTYAGRPFDAEALRRYLQPVRDFQLAYNAHIVIGEFSAVRWAPGADRYLADCTAIFEEYGWDWSYHAFREWGGWSFESADLPYDRDHHPLAVQPTGRALALQRWFALNQRPAAP